MLARNCLTFQNDGLLDLRAIKTFGVCSKETENPLGYFGTGLKYAIAITLRLGGRIEVWVGDTLYEFKKETKKFRVNEFDFIYLNDEELAFTTELGKNWEPWMAFREFYCNTIDEKSGVVLNGWATPEKGKTTIRVQCPDIYNTFLNKDEFFLPSPPLFVINFDGNQLLHVHKAEGQGFFHRGVRVGEFRFKPAFAYNLISQVKLTEDRTASTYTYASAIQTAVLLGDSPEFIKEIAQADTELEKSLDFTGFLVPEGSKTFITAIEGVPFKKITNNSIIQAYHRTKGQRYTPIPLKTLSTSEKAVFDIAIEIVAGFGYSTSYPTHVTEDLASSTWAIAYGGNIYISRACLEKGLRLTVRALIEEITHLDTGFSDQTLELQNWLFNKVLSLHCGKDRVIL